MDGKWESQLHTTRVKLRLKLSNTHTYAVTIAYDFKVSHQMHLKLSFFFLINFLSSQSIKRQKYPLISRT
jgi:hypothetical protein